MTFSKILFSAVIPFFAVGSDLAAADPDDAEEQTRKHIKQTLLGLPLRFEENTGHFDTQVKFLARGPGYTLFLTPNETILSLARKKSAECGVVRVRLENANADSVFQGESKLSTPTTYLIGNDPAKWHVAPSYERVRCASIYHGIDLVYHGKQQKLEYDFEVAPGADPNDIALRYSGVRRIRIDTDGSLILKLKDGGELRQHPPVTFQVSDGKRHEVASRYLVKPWKKVAFAIGQYDASQPLVIDPPVLDYSTYLGGSSSESINGIAVGPTDNVYVTGYTNSTNFPVLSEYQTDQTGLDVFVARLDTNASGAASLVYSTYLGGSGDEQGYAIATDSNGNAFVTGYTDSTDFPMFHQYQPNQTGRDAFVAKLDTTAAGAASLLYSTYLGGNGDDVSAGIAVGVAGNAFVTGSTTSTDFPILNEYQPDQGSTDAFVTKLDPSATGAASLVYSSYLGGSGTDLGTAIAVDESGRVYVTGYTSSSNFPKLNEYQGRQASFDAFLTKLNPLVAGVAGLLYSTYLGGHRTNIPNGIAVDSSRKAYLTGYTESTDFPNVNGYQTDQPGQDAFASRLDPDAAGAASLLYSTYLGGSSSDAGNGIVVDTNGNLYVAGSTDSTDYPTQDPLQTDLAGTDAFLTKINPTASGVASLLFSTYLAGDFTDSAKAIAIDSVNDVYVAGSTSSTNFPTLNQYQTDQTALDAFVTKYQTGPVNETCATAISIALDEVVIGKTGGAVNDYQLSGGACFTGFGQSASTAPGRDVVYSFIAPAGGSYSFRISNYGGGGDPVLYVASSCPAAGGSPVTVNTCLGASNRTGALGAYTSEEVMCLPLTSGQQVFIFVDEDTFVSGGTFVLEVNQCFIESEPNDTPATSDPLYFGVEGAINPFMDIDFFSLGVSGMTNARVFALIDGRAAPNKDFDLRLTTTTDTLEFDNADTDAPFGDLSPTIAGTPLTAAPPFLRIVTNTPPTGSEPYRIYAVVQPSGAGLGNSSATAESEPNGTTGQANSAANNFFSGSLTGPAPSNDRDFFSFTAVAGDLIFLSLDADPLRNNTPIDAKLALLDPDGVLLLQVNDGNSLSNTTSGAGSLGSTTPRSPGEGLVYRATESGTYYARVLIGTTSPTAIGAGDYLLSIAKGFRLLSAASRKTHGVAGSFDIPLPLTGTPGVECRSGGAPGNHTLVFTFNNTVGSGSPSFSAGVGSISGAPVFAGNTMTLNLTGVIDQQKITVSLIGMKDSLSQTLPNTNVSMNVLLGDVTGNKSVNATDVSQTKLQSGNAATATNFRSDVNFSGSINATDVSQVKLNSGHGLP
jgi:beta-propeller repeat-containing protein/dockerin type I repeat protein